MNSDSLEQPDPLLRGFYTVRDVARLLRLPNPQRIHRWFRPTQAGGNNVVIANDYERIGKFRELSFWDLIEVRFVEHFRSEGLSLQYLRKVAEKAREELDTQHPFALSGAKYLTDRKKIFLDIAEGEDRNVRDVLTGQYQFYETIERSIDSDLEFNPNTMLASSWFPMRDQCPNVVVNPRFAFGQPVVGENFVPTSTLYRQWQKTGNVKTIANWWRVNQADVKEAIEFENRIAV